ncbi:hypothetical protein V2J94_04040 [Streptomyces sp. DSM 41524]|uniref:Uncharacterized protein n=1 Tax=Streptomyces asiaticus subsp. ignotus TaxID=3098222 RepID=A0ABU7PPS2_9ACTN|nr:hypothetical protein [Streptomyces sp. DSM 41524]
MTENVSTAPVSLDETEKVRLAVYRGFARTGRAPSVPELSTRAMIWSWTRRTRTRS